MRYRILVAMGILLATCRVHAVALKGVIIANELGGPPLSNVQVGAIVGTNQTTSDDNGRFTLVFPQMRAGDAVTLTVSYEGQVRVALN